MMMNDALRVPLVAHCRTHRTHAVTKAIDAACANDVVMRRFDTMGCMHDCALRFGLL